MDGCLIGLLALGFREGEHFTRDATAASHAQHILSSRCHQSGDKCHAVLNGGPAATNQIVNPTVEPGNTLYIGNAGDNLGPSSEFAFHGVLDDIRIYNRALSASEVQQLYVIESGPHRIKLHRRAATVVARDKSRRWGSNPGKAK